MRLRGFALVLGLTLAATPLLGVVCAMDCDRPPTVRAGCHEAASTAGLAVHATQHACDHDHSGVPAVLTNSTGRELIGAVVAIPAATIARAPVHNLNIAAVAMHGPPGLTSSTRTPLRLTSLRI